MSNDADGAMTACCPDECGISFATSVLQGPSSIRAQISLLSFARLEANLQLSCVHWNVFASRPLGRRKPECVMDWNRIEGNWKQFKGQAKEKWGRLTDDDLDVINGRQDQLEGKIQERYGLAKDQAKKNVEAWFNSLP
jgi:uncharacterized protein YjbJ (UPF0337 family)